MHSEDPVWKQLINNTLTTHERKSLVTEIFSDNNQVEVVGQLSWDDTQKFIDVIDEVTIQKGVFVDHGSTTYS